MAKWILAASIGLSLVGFGCAQERRYRPRLVPMAEAGYLPHHTEIQRLRKAGCPVIPRRCR